MRKIAIFLLLSVKALTSQAQLLWKVSGNGLQRQSYIIGTGHFAPAAFADSIHGLDNVLDEIEQVYGEIEEAQLMKNDYMAMMDSAMMLPDGLTIEKLFGEEEMRRINVMFEKAFGTNMVSQAMLQAVNSMSTAGLLLSGTSPARKRI